jgi:RNA polymerase sigma-70 factor (ECF subfamily)
MKKFISLSEEELIHQYQQNYDIEIVGELYNRYHYMVLGIALKYLNDLASAEDAAMAIFEDLIKVLQKADVKSFKPWLATVTRNYLHKQYRTATKQPQMVFEEEFVKKDALFMELVEDNTHVNEKIEIEQQEETLLKAVNTLKPEQANCIRLFFLEQKSYVEICEQTGYSFKDVKSYIQNGKRNLKIILDGEL